MASYRRMRQQARQARRGGMQPMMVFNADPGQFPAPAGVLLARLAWRYRSELAPVWTVAVLFGAGWWAHAEFFRWREFIVSGFALAAWLIITFGARAGLAALAERIYAATATLAAGAWLTYAAVLGPGTPPLPQALGIGGAILAIPWWAHRRRRAKVRVERKLAAWPGIARTIGLAGSEVMSATVDLWGWRARFRGSPYLTGVLWFRCQPPGGFCGYFE